MIGRIFAFLWAFSFLTCSLYAGTYYVSTAGVDQPANGTLANPWRTLTYASSQIPDDGSTVLVMDGIYDGRIRLNRRFVNHTVFKAMNAYKAVLRHTNEQIVTSFGGANFTFEGFRLTRPNSSATGALIMQVQQGTDPAEDIIIRNNIFHDSYNNDLLKINNLCDNILVEENVFYNQSGSDEHIDVNGVTNVTIQDNIFFNDFAGSGRPDEETSSFIVIKNSGELPLNENFIVRRNVFLNWEGSNGSAFITIGEDGKPFIETENVVVENNLMLGNSSNDMRVAFGVKSGKNVTFRNNTVSGDLPSLAYAMRLNVENPVVVNEDIRFYNNIWSDPTGTMEDLSDGDDTETVGEVLDNNLYYNGGNPIPPGDVFSIGDDANAVVGNPVLGSHSGLILPRWDANAGEFLSGTTTIRDEFLRLVGLYGIPGTGSAAIGAADPVNTPIDDILGNARDGSPDMGAFETGASVLILLSPASLPNGSAGSPYNQTISATGGAAPYSFALLSGTLPPGLTLSPAGTLSGTPTTGGDYPFTITAIDSNADTGTRNYSISIVTCLFCDDFENGTPDPNWTYAKPAWSEAGGNLIGNPTGRKAIAVASPVFTGCTNCTVEASMRSAGGFGNRVWLLAWYQNKQNTIELLMKEENDRWILKQRSGGRIVRKTKAAATINPNTFYNVEITFDGSTFEVFVNGQSLITMQSAAASTGTVGFQSKSTAGTFGFIQVF